MSMGTKKERKVKKEVNERRVNLLIIADDDTNHYCFIMNFGRLVGSPYSKGKSKIYFCRFCLHGFSSHSASRDKAQHRGTVEEMEEKLKKHEERCFAFVAQRTEFPNDPILKFENIQKRVEAPFTVYADLENILKQSSGDGNKCQEQSLVLMPTKLLVVCLELNLNRGYILE